VTRRRSGALLVAIALIVGAACSDDDDGDDEPAPSSTSAPAASGSTAPSSSRPAATSPVRVYFARTEKVATAGREVEPPALARGALLALLEGPDEVEAGIGMGSEIPDGTRLRGVNISDGAATVDLSDEFQQGGGSSSMQLRVAQVVFTLTQFDTVESVSIRIDGVDVTAIGGEGVPATDLDRADFPDQTPLILVESPVPGERVTSPVTISGIANTFEANVQYAIVGPDDLPIADGFTTATAGTGTWGDFSVSAPFTATAGTPATVRAFESSARDGQPVNVYDVPVRLG
jgi:hypothetical protein